MGARAGWARAVAGATSLTALALAPAVSHGATLPTTVAGNAKAANGYLGLWLKVGKKKYPATAIKSKSSGPGSSWTAVLRTSDPAKRTITVRFTPASGGIATIAASADGKSPDSIGMDFAASSGERWFGFGERSDMVSRGGESGASTVENYVSDGPWQPSEWKGIGAMLPPGGSRGRMDSTYFPIPWTLSTRSYGVLIDDNDTSRFTFGGKTARSWSVDVDGTRLDLRVFSAATPAATLDLYTRTTGRQPPAAAPWYFGPWFQSPGDPSSSIFKLKVAGSPTSVGMTYAHYLPCGSDRGRESSMIATANLWHTAGLAVTTYFNPMVCDTYKEVFDPASTSGALTAKAGGGPYVYRYVASSIFHVGQFDFTSQAGVDQFQSLLQRAVDHGFDGWMEDFGEYTPIDGISSDGTPGPAMHNLYPRLYHRAAHQFAQRTSRPLARFQRSGWSGTAPYAQVVWGGDPSTDWGFDGLASVVKDGIGMGLSGVSLWGSDIGGYFSLSKAVPLLTTELLQRWVEVGFASGVMRNETDGLKTSYIPRPQVTDLEVLPIWTAYSRLRTQLYPYLAAAQKQYDASGMPLMRSLLLTNPTDAKAIARDDEYMFGPDILVAPVLSPGATTRTAYLPAGTWVDFWRSARLEPTSGGLEPTGATLLSGSRDQTVPAPIGELPMFVKAGAAIPLVTPDVWTLSDYGTGVVHLGDRADRRRIVAFPRGSWSGALGPGETLGSVEGTGSWTLSIGSSTSRTYSIMASFGSLNQPFTPCDVKVGSSSLPRDAWSWDPSARILRATATLAGGTITATGAC